MLINCTERWHGKMLDRYRLLHLLGRGGMSEVWLAEDTLLQRQVAAKLLNPVLMNEKDYLRVFGEEARVVAALEHPHILPIHDFGEVLLGDEVAAYLIMPVVSGGSLRDYLRHLPPGGLLPIAESLHYLRQAAEAIDFAYQKRVIHRDIKPGNMLLQGDWLFLGDFGLARLLSTNTYRSRTKAGAGTPEYMAPEQIRGRAVAASDRYSLAVVAYQLLTGHLPFQDEEPFTLFLRHLREDPPSPRLFNPQLPELMAQAILKCLAKAPAARYLSCLAFVEALEQSWKSSSSHSLVASDANATLIPEASQAISNSPNSAHLLSQSSSSSAQASPAPRVTPRLPTPDLPQEPSHDQPSPSADSAAKPDSRLTPRQSERGYTLGRRALLLGSAAVLVAGGSFDLATSLLHAQKRTGPQQLMAGKPLLKLTRSVDTVWNVRWHPNGRYLALSAGNSQAGFYPGDSLNYIQVWDIGKLLAARQSTAYDPDRSWVVDDLVRANCLDWSSDGNKLGLVTDAYTYSNSTWVYSLITIDVFAASNALKQYTDSRTTYDKTRYTAVAWSPKEDTLATLTHPEYQKRPQGIALWQLDKQQNFTRLLTNPQPETMLDLSEEDMTSDLSRPFYDNKNHTLCWSCDGAYLLAQDNQLNIRIWSVNTTAPMQVLSVLDCTAAIPMGKKSDVSVQMYIPRVIASPTDPSLFATNDLDVIVVGDLTQRKVQRLLKSSDSDALYGIKIAGTRYYPQISALAWSPNGRYLAAAYMSSVQIFIWDLQDPDPRKDNNGLQLPTLSFGKTGGHSSYVITNLAWSPDGRYLASSSFDTTVVIWQVDKT